MVLLCQHLNDSPSTAKHIQVESNKDPLLSKVQQYILQSWPDFIASQPALRPFFECKLELSVYQGCNMCGSRVLIPEKYYEQVLVQLHEGHPGVARMKNLSRMYVWWPGISRDIESTIRQCTQCQLYQSTPPVAPLQLWSWPTRPWTRLHLDYAGPFEGKMILVLTDAHSKWIEGIHTPNATSMTTIEELWEKFAQFSIPQTIVTDNGACFTSADFESFLSNNGIQHLTTAPYYPASNGLAKHAVQIVKKGLKKNEEPFVLVYLVLCFHIDLHLKLQRQCHLLSYCLTEGIGQNWTYCDQILQKGWRGNSSLRRNYMAVIPERSSVLVQKCGYIICKEATSDCREWFWVKKDQ